MDALTAARIGLGLAEERGRGKLTSAYQTILEHTLGPAAKREGTIETPLRAAKAWQELTEGYDVDVAALFKVFDAEGYDEMVAVSGIPFASLCEHHMLPFIGTAHVVYLPTAKIVGLSKIPRVVNAFARRLQNQERLTAQIADALEEHLDPRGVLVMCEAEHSCMQLRGVKSHGVMRTSVTRGYMRDRPESRAEAFALIGRSA